jgi:LPXTG-motif cell wall-anchored protein
MKQQPHPLRRAACLLLTAAALPFTPLAAQDTQPVPEPFAVEVPAPVAVTPVEVPAPDPVVAEPAPAAETTAPPPAARRASQARPAARTAPRTAQVRSTAPVRQAQPAPAPAAPAAEATPAPIPAEATIPPVVLPAPETPAPVAEESGMSSNLLLLVGGALVLGALALFFMLRRRRRTGDEVIEREDSLHEADSDCFDEVPVAAGAAAPLADAEDEPLAATETGRPWLDLQMRPVRAGVTGEDAVVEFELSVDNQGNAPARDIRISTWMFAAGSSRETEMERSLIERPGDSELPSIGAGDGERIESSVALPTAGLAEDAVLPVVVAEARYRLPDGSEGRTSASFAVGVPDGEELAHFAIDNPSGFHDDVEARPLGEVERA